MTQLGSELAAEKSAAASEKTGSAKPSGSMLVLCKNKATGSETSSAPAVYTITAKPTGQSDGVDESTKGIQCMDRTDSVEEDPEAVQAEKEAAPVKALEQEARTEETNRIHRLASSILDNKVVNYGPGVRNAKRPRSHSADLEGRDPAMEKRPKLLEDGPIESYAIGSSPLHQRQQQGCNLGCSR
ncbi:hypothetical protein PG994_008631 [Apiospora phragmitis]|uniref:Uncharacterized protein n=1 Tax=Apiospora phragmitis TaxID=2905665 RepID=A0ABR1UH13_9PEZI